MAAQRGDPREIIGARPTALQVYLAMEYLSGGRDQPFEASVAQIQALTNQSPPTVLDAINTLVHARVVSSVVSPGRTTRYQLLKNFARLFYKRGEAKVPSTRSKLLRSSSSTEEPSKKFKTSKEARREAVRTALRALGSPSNATRLVGQSMKELFGLVEHDGFTIADALEVVKFCRLEYDRTKFRPLLSLPYVWSSRQFTSLLTAARTTLKDDGETLAEKEKRQSDYARRLKEKGLMP